MTKKSPQEDLQRATERDDIGLPNGVQLLHVLQGHSGQVWSISFNPQGSILASASEMGSTALWDVNSGDALGVIQRDGCRAVAFDPSGEMLAIGDDNDGAREDKIGLWDPQSGELLRSFGKHENWIVSLAFDPSGSFLASGSFDDTVKLWDMRSGRLLRSLAHTAWVWSVSVDPQGQRLASAGDDGTVQLWDARNGRRLHTLLGHRRRVFTVAFDSLGQSLASGSSDNTVKLWDPESGKLLRSLEGHTKAISDVAFSPDGQLLASRSLDGTVRLWDRKSWETIAVLPNPAAHTWQAAGLSFHPRLPLLAAGSEAAVRVWKLDLHATSAGHSQQTAVAGTIHHATAKVVLVGDHSVGKSGLAHRLIHGNFKEQSSTHGQQFWVFPDLGQRRSDGTDCEAILWDLAGQPDYRLVHALFVDNADLALILFDASDLRDPLRGVSFWLKQLQVSESRCPIILVPAQVDRGTCPLTPDELSAFCRKEDIAGPISTSASTGEGISQLVECMKSMIAWESKAATVTTTTFKRIKDYVLAIKEAKSEDQTLVTLEELRASLERTDADWQFTDAELKTATGHLENYGYVKRLRTSSGSERILLRPELLNNLASSFVLEARRHPKGLGALEERRLLAGGYDFPELRQLEKEERELLLDSAALLFLEHHVCFRETDPLRMEPYLVFPELINLKRPPEDGPATEDGLAYTLLGPTENVFASLVVLLGYTHTFTRTAQWQDHARYEMGEDLVCAFRQEAGRDGEVDLILSFGANVGLPVRTLFQGLIESFLARRNLTVLRYESVRCSDKDCGQLLDRSVVRQRLKEGKNFAFCNDCGAKLALPTMAEPIQLTREVKAEVEVQRRAAQQRTRFEQAIFSLRAYTAEEAIAPPETFISYAWGVPEHERWVERRLATDLQKAGIDVVLDRWHNAQIGANVARFVERIEKCDRIVIVGTPCYRRKYENKDASTGYVVAAEVDVINNRLLGTEEQKKGVLPLLVNGEKANALPPLLHGRVYADFRDEDAYFSTAFDLILSLYLLPPNHPAIADLRESLIDRRSR